MATVPAAGRDGRRWWVLAGFAAAVVVVALVGSLGVQGSREEYAALAKPAWAPPGWLFGPVWSVLYAMIAVAGWLVWRRVGFTRPLWVYAAQLVLNALWTPLFFGGGAYGLALLDISALLVLVAVTIGVFHRVSRSAALLLVPYWLWVAYATALNFALWRANS
ncbi:TspO/MBR family protein [Saccharothrix algeriensis]|uniref:Tryptophan-rich sensory protein n=1 Tax=Saccharothrix algeriensis TaxID=173560 RepID=A0A8T8I0S8_9PSEU|nr:TspO/MBR family protein [Saccharothrix algeriensis]MBM7809216.1 tryptophan-rich sensory protein [Saccharothrix algeriensis]QTR03574.1 tryptophan-rich sensory protein [Saccharothrix algeriensis]